MAYYNGKNVVMTANLVEIPVDLVQEGGVSKTKVISQAGVTNNFANAPKKTVKGSGIIVINDVSPIEHTLKIKVSSTVEPVGGSVLLRAGSDFNVYNQFTINADGTVNGVTSRSPMMQIWADVVDATIEVEYIRDINKTCAIADALSKDFVAYDFEYGAIVSSSGGVNDAPSRQRYRTGKIAYSKKDQIGVSEGYVVYLFFYEGNTYVGNSGGWLTGDIDLANYANKRADSYIVVVAVKNDLDFTDEAVADLRKIVSIYPKDSVIINLAQKPPP